MLENYTVIDLEMTGLHVKKDIILEVGAVRVRGGMAVETYTAILNVDRQLPVEVVELTGISQQMVDEGENPQVVMERFFSFIGEDVLVGQNIIFDYSFLKQWAVNHNIKLERKALDTLKLSRQFLPKEEKKDLESLCVYFGIERVRSHRALDDAVETWKIFEELKRRYGAQCEKAFLPYPLQYKVKKQTPATARQKKYLQQYAQAIGIELPKDFEQMTKSEASRLVDQWILQYGKMLKN